MPTCSATTWSSTARTGDDRLSGLFDFFFAGIDTLALRPGGVPERLVHRPAPAAGSLEDRAAAFCDAYQRVRPLASGELRLMPALLRAAALRFWLSRLWDLHLPRDAALLQAKDPGALRARAARAHRPPLAPAALNHLTMALTIRQAAPMEGVQWMRDAFRLFLRRPAALQPGCSSSFLLVALLATLVPLVGGVVMLMSLPLLSLGFMLASRAAQNDLPVHPGQFIEPLRGERSRRNTLLSLCAAVRVGHGADHDARATGSTAAPSTGCRC